MSLSTAADKGAFFLYHPKTAGKSLYDWGFEGFAKTAFRGLSLSITKERGNG